MALPEPANREPAQITAGETLRFKRTLPSCPAGTWTLNYYLNGPQNYTFAATADGADHLVEVAAATTANWFPGRYALAARVTNGATVLTVVVAVVLVEILPNPATRLQSSAERRSYAAVTLEAVEAAITKLAGKTVSSASVNGQSYSFADISKLVVLRDQLREELRNEQAEQNIAAGLGSGRKILTRFLSPR